MRRMALLIAASLVVASASSAIAAPKATAAAKRSKTVERAKSPSKGTMKQCSAKGSKRQCKRVAVFQGHAASKGAFRTEPLEKPTGNVWLYAENLNEEVKVNIYKPDGSYNEGSLAKLDEIMRCRQTGEVRAIRADLYEQLSRISDHFGGDKRIELISGFRFAERSSSRHFHASAMDIRVPGISIREAYKFAETLDAGNMGIGIYPTSNFIHVDFRAPGEPSYRWTDYSGHSGPKRKTGKTNRPTGRTMPARKPVT
ncbi:MAG TPA: DUF882 domain-containing protein [Kofleriaceae bacterium]